MLLAADKNAPTLLGTNIMENHHRVGEICREQLFSFFLNQVRCRNSTQMDDKGKNGQILKLACMIDRKYEMTEYPDTFKRAP